MSTEVQVTDLRECAIHAYVLGVAGVPATVDGRTRMGPWADMCDACVETYGVGLGTGGGQRLIVK